MKRAPEDVRYGYGFESLQYDIDIDYVTMKGGVAKCFNAGARSGTPTSVPIRLAP